jgi:hypothetical protein
LCEEAENKVHNVTWRNVRIVSVIDNIVSFTGLLCGAITSYMEIIVSTLEGNLGVFVEVPIILAFRCFVKVADEYTSDNSEAMLPE